MDSIIWAFRHTERNVAETGLNLLLEMLTNFQVIFNLISLRRGQCSQFVMAAHLVVLCSNKLGIELTHLYYWLFVL
jgi:hypothetical protein